MIQTLLYLKTLAQLRGNEVPVPQQALDATDLRTALQMAFGLAGGIALVVVTYGGFKYTTSRANPEAVAKARNTIVYALVGLTVAITGFGIVSFVTDRV